MCGIAGFFDPTRGRSTEALNRIAAAMADRLVHRGPDDAGVYSDAAVGLAMGFRRLAIQDLSPEGAQPMLSASGRYVIVFNGEIYNFQQIRNDLEGRGAIAWRGGSDTEVMLAAIERFGLTDALALFDGMFAFALYDRKRRLLHLVRDRMGEKPLYYGWSVGAFVFGSEMKALVATPEWAPRIDRDALAAYMRYGYVPAPHSIHKEIHKLTPGHTITIALDDSTPGSVPIPVAYWDARREAEAAEAHPFSGDFETAADRVEALLTSSIRRRMIADVPLGVFLSGGVDSATVAALAQKVSDRPIRTFTVGFADPRFDEAKAAAAIAAHLGTDHLELTASPDALLGLVDRMPTVYDEPFADASQLPTLLLAEMTRRQVTVALSGDGGDELFAGYPRYQAAATVFERRTRVSKKLLAVLARAGRRIPVDKLNRLSLGNRPWRLGDKLSRTLEDAGVVAVEEIYERYCSRWRIAAPPCPAPEIGYLAEPVRWPELRDPISRLTYADAVGYLPDDLLVKIDRATMAVGLEARAPMLNHEFVAFVWSLPASMKFRDGRSKWLLRQVLNRHVPTNLVDRPKQGFEPPLGDWLRGPLRDWAEELLTTLSQDSEGLFDERPVRAAWREHLAGARDWRFELWHVLMFQAWRKAWLA